ncbi:MAG: S-layer homology domain-containing protein, partial [Clostridia bacterium]|nr:S-layer homology domain-containing protein [Clostridia bacterium]
MKKLTKLLSLLIALVFLAGTLPGTVFSEGALPFRDVKEADWFYPYVSYVYENGLMNGTGGKTFSPEDTLDRAMFITIIGRLVGAESSAPSPFKDTEPNTWYSPYVAWAADLGVVNGFPDGTFRPYEAITREQMAAATDRFLNATGLNAIAGGGIFNFADEAKVSDWAVESVGNLKKIGIFTGDTAGRFNPESNTTRAEAATVVTRLKKAIDAAWQGYTPKSGEDALIYGAKYLFENGSILSGGMKRGLDESGEYPLLTLTMNGTTAFATYLSANTTGISVSLAEFFPEEYPVVKICYSFDGMEETVPTAFYRTNNTQ